MNQKAGAILRYLREQGGFVSGEELSRLLDISRTAVWKHVSALREQGCAIESAQSRGYRLLSAPDLLVAEELSPLLKREAINYQVICLDETASTNSEAFRLADMGAPEGTVVIADSQNSGRGRMGRIWSSPAGVNLYCSVVLRPGIMPYEAPQLTFLSSAATARAIELSTGLTCEIKWPNDVLIGGRKVAGLLNEMSAETDGVTFVVLGIGVNLNMTAVQFPADLRYPATSLVIESGQPVNRILFSALLLNELDRRYADFLANGFPEIRREWEQKCNAHGREVIVSDGGNEVVRGLFGGIDSDGALLVLANGKLERILSGDVTVLNHATGH